MSNQPFQYGISRYIRQGSFESPSTAEPGPADKLKAEEARSKHRKAMASPPPLAPGQLWANILQLHQLADDPEYMPMIFEGQRLPTPDMARRKLSYGFRRLLDVKNLAASAPDHLSEADQRAVAAFRAHSLLLAGDSYEERNNPGVESRGLEVVSFLALENDEQARAGMALRQYQGGLALISTVKLFHHQQVSS